jgi:tRNA pseudouridine55 synthase
MIRPGRVAEGDGEGDFSSKRRPKPATIAERMQEFSSLDGAILVDKPAGPTSHDVVDAIRRRFGIKKVGHCGTLDPNATGLLIIVLGRGTKLSEKLMSDDKLYEGTIQFGEATDSYDADGEITASLPVPPLTLEELTREAAEFVGDRMQIPPMVSAVKKDGVPLYKLARKGLEVKREPRLVHIYSFRFSDYHEPLAQFRIACTKGTYVRSLAHELGQKIGCGAHLSALRRIASGKFDVARALPLDRIIALSTSELEQRVIPFLKLAGGEANP